MVGRQEVTGAWRVSLRSRGAVDVAAVAERFGGGGHERAAGFTVGGHLRRGRRPWSSPRSRRSEVGRQATSGRRARPRGGPAGRQGRRSDLARRRPGRPPRRGSASGRPHRAPSTPPPPASSWSASVVRPSSCPSCSRPGPRPTRRGWCSASRPTRRTPRARSSPARQPDTSTSAPFCEVLTRFQRRASTRCRRWCRPLKVDGERLHEIARRGEVVEREPRRVTVHDLVLDGYGRGRIATTRRRRSS